MLKKNPKSFNFWENLSTLTQKNALTNFLGIYPCTKTRQKKANKVSHRNCAVVFIGNCSQLSNHTSFFPTNRCRSILLKRWQWLRERRKTMLLNAHSNWKPQKLAPCLTKWYQQTLSLFAVLEQVFFYLSIIWVFKSHVNVLLLFPQIRCWPIHGSRSLLCGCWKQVFVCTLVDTNILVMPKTATLPQHDFCTRDG